ncbi:hypothetical protein ACTJIJ_15415 [Niabella sp. 22666]|uniref:hypothetical protein n=1 Tax=Niabella sp. 22666 TaxID=3453954 RepID=UPI003F84CF27
MIKYINWMSSLLIVFFNVVYYIPVLTRVLSTGNTTKYMAVLLVCICVSIFSIVSIFSFVRQFMQSPSILILNLVGLFLTFIWLLFFVEHWQVV